MFVPVTVPTVIGTLTATMAELMLPSMFVVCVMSIMLRLVVHQYVAFTVALNQVALSQLA